MPDRLLITGAAGLIGGEVARLGLARGCDVMGVDLTGAPDLDEPWVQGIDWVRADLADGDRWRDRARGCQALVHAVSPLRPDHARQLLEIARQAHIPRLVLLSTSDELPGLPPGHTTQAREAEQAACGAGDAPPTCVILRTGLVWGPRRSIPEACARLLSATSPPPAIAPERVERVGMAALRAALEPEHHGVLEPDQIAHLGDAMMIQ